MNNIKSLLRLASLVGAMAIHAASAAQEDPYTESFRVKITNPLIVEKTSVSPKTPTSQRPQ